MLLKAAAAAALLLLAAAPARANFEYTRWGMAERAAIAASRGTVRAFPPAQRRAAGGVEYRAGGTFQAESNRFGIAFGFGPAGLRCVSYHAAGPAAGVALRAWLISRYGQPGERGGQTDQGQESLAWTQPDRIDFEMGPSGALALQCAPDQG
ncbi:MAG TPA: hypothetical protein VGM87_10310 [Roseomonas sp.]